MICLNCNQDFNDVNGVMVCDDCLTTDYFRCDDCGKWRRNNDLYVVTGEKNVCEACFSENYDKCSYCELYVNVNDLSRIDGQYICCDCREGYFSQCEDCEDWHHNDSLNSINGNHAVCDHCLNNYVACENCGTYIYFEDIICTADSRSICDNCFDDNYFRCNGCNRVYYYTDDVGHGYCAGCCDEHDGNGGCVRILPYSIKLAPKFFKVDGEKVNYYMGVELEVGGGPDQRGCKYVQRDLYYCKNDASIPNYGFEIVSYPATLAYHKSRFEKTKEMFEKLIEYGYRSHDIDNCGLHVHVDKEVLTDLQWIKLDFFINNQPDLMFKIARRNSDFGKVQKKRAKDCGKNIDRYSALNFCPTITNEFRLFRGTLNVKTYIATLEIVDLFLRLARSIPAKILVNTDTAEKYFYEILERSDYEFAKAYIADRINR